MFSGWTLLSLLVHSRCFTDSTLLFLMLPATLDWLCYAVVFTVALQIMRAAESGGKYDHLLRRSLPMVLVAGIAVCAGNGLAQYIGESQAGRPDARVAGTFFSPNFAAGAYALALPLACVAALWASNAARFTVGAVVTALLIGGLAVTGSRVGALAAATGLALTFGLLLIYSRGKLPWLRLGVLTVAAIVMLFVYGKPLLSRVSAGDGKNAPVSSSAAGNEQSGEFRQMTWRGTIRMATANPLFGTGAGTFPVRYPPYAVVAKTDLAHQSYLQMASEQGIPAFLFLLIVVLPLTVGTGHSFRARDGSLPTALLLCGVCSGVVAGLMRGIGDSEWSIMGDALPFWALAGTLYSTFLKEVRPEVRVSRFRMLFAALLLVPLFLAAILLRNTSARDTAAVLVRSAPPGDIAATRAARQAAQSAAQAWPPDPDALALAGGLRGRGAGGTVRETVLSISEIL